MDDSQSRCVRVVLRGLFGPVVCILGGLVARSTRLVTRSLGQWHRCYRRAKRTSVDLGFAELELGTTVRDVIAHVGGGTRPGRSIKAVFSGVSTGVITADHLDVPATYEHLAAIGGGLGSAEFIVYDDTADMAAVARMFARFLHVEPCGQCGACKLRSGTVSDTLARLRLGAADDHDIAQLGPALQLVTDQNRCYLPSNSRRVIASILRELPGDFVAHLEGTPGPPRTYRLPKIADMSDGTVTYDGKTVPEQPGWAHVDVRRAG